jgi:hypothetical protein
MIEGYAIVLHLIEAARAVAHADGPLSPEGQALVAWVTELEDRLTRETAAGPVGWEPRRWRELIAGDRVELGGVEAVIASAVTQNWHVDPEKYTYHPGSGREQDSECRACGGQCRETRGRKYQALEHSITEVRLEGRDPVYQMPPDGEVETLRGPAGQAVDEVNGHRSRVPGGVEPIEVLGSWVADAVGVLEAAGLGPIEVMEVRES